MDNWDFHFTKALGVKTGFNGFAELLSIAFALINA